MSAAGTLKRWLQRLIRTERGVAAVEFALILPIMVLTYVGTLEASTLITMDRKVQSVAGAMGDLVARVDGSVTASQMQDFFRASSGIMTPYSSSAVQQVVTAVRVNNDRSTTVLWSRKYEGGVYSSSTPHAVGAAFAPLPEEMINIALGQTVIAAEAHYSYTPLLGVIFDRPVHLYRSSFFMPRFGAPVGIQ
ncbi:TadE/TadG family type IV pilus assembly protein [uncultured Devosia sp.]|uniref:TadE/TadG family type IV pilus assembly protein n=1 Tax=uncultured Devosia sp. TaxID=211434 RepID=UPI00260A1D88|nr:TadE/TadG family type IV pilus assembly protein [uncultured Devosia sp.]